MLKKEGFVIDAEGLEVAPGFMNLHSNLTIISLNWSVL